MKLYESLNTNRGRPSSPRLQVSPIEMKGFSVSSTRRPNSKYEYRRTGTSDMNKEEWNGGRLRPLEVPSLVDRDRWSGVTSSRTHTLGKSRDVKFESKVGPRPLPRDSVTE